MEFHRKLQELRKREGLTQQQLAESLYVSRTAISKWESGRGLPGIDSLKAIAGYFSVTVDELLSDGELPTAGDKAGAAASLARRFGILDCSTVLLFFLPFFAQRGGTLIRGISLLSLSGTALYLRVLYYALVLGMSAVGVCLLASAGGHGAWRRISLGLNAAGALLFVIGLHPYAAAYLLALLAIKGYIGQKEP